MFSSRLIILLVATMIAPGFATHTFVKRAATNPPGPLHDIQAQIDALINQFIPPPFGGFAQTAYDIPVDLIDQVASAILGAIGMGAPAAGAPAAGATAAGAPAAGAPAAGAPAAGAPAAAASR